MRSVAALSFASLLVVTSLSAQQLAQSGSPQGGPTSPNNTIDHHQIQVAASNDEWTNTGFKVSPGDLVVIFAAGTVRLGAATGSVDANGFTNGAGALQAKVGAATSFPVGSRFAFQAADDSKGTLKLRINDSRYMDNSGALTVTVVRIPGGMIPQATQYDEDQ